MLGVLGSILGSLYFAKLPSLPSNLPHLPRRRCQGFRHGEALLTNRTAKWGFGSIGSILGYDSHFTVAQCSNHLRETISDHDPDQDSELSHQRVSKNVAFEGP